MECFSLRNSGYSLDYIEKEQDDGTIEVTAKMTIDPKYKASQRLLDKAKEKDTLILLIELKEHERVVKRDKKERKLP